LCDSFPIQVDLKQGDALSQILFNIALESAIRQVQEHKEEPEVSGMHQLLLCAADDVNLLDENINRPIIKIKAGALLDDNKEFGL
jgi:hypothetical protein